MNAGKAKEHANFLGAEITHIVKIPGVFDMGLAIKKLLEKRGGCCIALVP